MLMEWMVFWSFCTGADPNHQTTSLRPLDSMSKVLEPTLKAFTPWLLKSCQSFCYNRFPCRMFPLIFMITVIALTLAPQDHGQAGVTHAQHEFRQRCSSLFHRNSQPGCTLPADASMRRSPPTTAGTHVSFLRPSLHAAAAAPAHRRRFGRPDPPPILSSSMRSALGPGTSSSSMPSCTHARHA